jgi:hypothetical protein
MDGTGRATVAMPSLLKWLSWAGPLLLLIGIVPLFDERMLVFGRPMPHGWWWSSGAVALAFVPGVVVCAAAILVIRRSGFARTVYVLGWLLLTLSIPLMGQFAGFDPADANPALIANGVCTALIAAYLYASPDVRRYFDTALP